MPRACCCGNYGHSSTDQLGCKRRQPIQLVLRPAVLDRDAFALDVADFLQALSKCGDHVRIQLWCRCAQESDDWNRRLLPPRSQRPRRRTTEGAEKFAPPHSITSSARGSALAEGTTRSSDLAIFRFKPNSNAVGCSMGISAGATHILTSGTPFMACRNTLPMSNTYPAETATTGVSFARLGRPSILVDKPPAIGKRRWTRPSGQVRRFPWFGNPKVWYRRRLATAPIKGPCGRLDRW